MKEEVQALKAPYSEDEGLAVRFCLSNVSEVGSSHKKDAQYENKRGFEFSSHFSKDKNFGHTAWLLSLSTYPFLLLSFPAQSHPFLICLLKASIPSLAV